MSASANMQFSRPEMEELEPRLLLSTYPGIPDDILTANDFFIFGENGIRITDVKVLAQQYAPVLRLSADGVAFWDRAERYHPKEVEIVTAHLPGTPYSARPNVYISSSAYISELRQIGDLGAFTGTASENYYIDLPGSNIDEINAHYDTIKDQYSDCVYTTIVKDPGSNRIAVQYWFFYYGNDFWNTHEGDWEGMTVFFDQSGPYGVYYNTHQDGIKLSWADAEHTFGYGSALATHVVGYVASGSHATYPHSGQSMVVTPDAPDVTDYHYGSGTEMYPITDYDLRIMPQDLTANLTNIDGHDMSWLPYTGLWGQMGLGGSLIDCDGPRGPGPKDSFSNPFSKSPAVPVRSPADLACQSFRSTASQPFMGPGVVDIAYTIGNSGQQLARDFTVKFYLSDDANITASDILLDTQTIALLGPTCIYTNVYHRTLPAIPATFTDNEYFIGIIVDAGNTVAESSETNNSNRGLFLDREVLSAEKHLPSPNTGLNVQADWLTYDSFWAGIGTDEWAGARDIDTYSFTPSSLYGTHTVGFDLDTSAAGLDSYMRLYDANWNLLASSNDNAAPGENAVGIKDSYLEYTFSNTDLYFIVVSSYDNRLADPRTMAGRASGTTGDYRLTASRIIPDLVASSVTLAPATPLGDGRFAVNYTISNSGLGPAAASRADVYVLEDLPASASGLTPIASISVPSLAGQQNYSGSITVDLADADIFRSDNQYWVAILVDAGGTVVETNETNNWLRQEGIGCAILKSDRHSNFDGFDQEAIPDAIAIGSTITAAIGDEWIGAYDFDFYCFDAAVGQTLAFDIDRPGGSLNSYIRLYDAWWNLLASNDNAAAPGETLGIDAYLQYNFLYEGSYNLLVCSNANAAVAPGTNPSSRVAGTTGAYTITVSDVLPNLQATSASVSAPTALGDHGIVEMPFTITNIGNGAAGSFNVDFYLADSSGAVPSGATAVGHWEVDARFLSNGCLLPGEAYSRIITLDLSDPDPLRTDNQYFLSYCVNADHSLVESSYADNKIGAATGISSEWNLNSPASAAIASPMSVGSTISGSIGDEWIGAYDIDVWSFTVAAPGNLGFDLDRTGGNLDAHLRLYNSSWGLLASNNNAAAPGEVASSDPYLLYNFTAAGTYYAVIASASNAGASPLNLAGRTSGTTGSYELTIALPLPDLMGLSLTLDPISSNGVTTAHYSIRNQGCAATGASTATFFLSDNNSIDPYTDHFLHYVDVPALAAGETYYGNTPLYMSCGSFGPDPLRTDNQYWVGMYLSASGWTDADPSNNLNRGDGIDRVMIHSENNLPVPLDGGHVVATGAALGQTVAGNIGGDEWIGGADMDVYSFSLLADQIVVCDVDNIVGTLDTYLRLYDSSWNLVAFNDDGQGGGETLTAKESYIAKKVRDAGTYYLVASDTANSAADARTLSGRSTSGKSGTFDLTISLSLPELSALAPVPVSGPLVPAGGGMTFDLSILNSGYGAAAGVQVRLVLSDNQELTHDDPILWETILPQIKPGAAWTHAVEVALPEIDPFFTDNQYWISVIVDPENTVAEINDGNNVAVTEVWSESHLAHPLSLLPAAVALAIGSPVTTALGDEWVGGFDIDVYSVNVGSKRTVGFDLDSDHEGFDSYMRLYDSAGNLVRSNNNGAAPGEGSGSDSYIELKASSGGQYYLVVSSVENGHADYLSLDGRVRGGVGGYSISMIDVVPDLTLSSLVAPAALVWGQWVNFAGVLANLGNASSGLFDVGFYLSTDATITTDDPCLDARVVSSLAAGESVLQSFELTLPTVNPAAFSASGTIYLGVIVDQTGKKHELDESNNTWVSDAIQIIPAKLIDAAHPVTIIDADGDTVTARLSGLGSGLVIVPPGCDIQRITLDGTDVKSKLAISLRKGATAAGVTSLGGVDVSGAMSSISAPLADLARYVSIGGSINTLTLRDALSGSQITIGPGTNTAVLKLTLARATDLSLTSDTPISALRAVEWINSDLASETIRTPWIGSLTITGCRANARGGMGTISGDFEAQLVLTGDAAVARTLNFVKIAGNIAASQWQVTGAVNSITIAGAASQWNLDVSTVIGALTVKGLIDDATVRAGTADAKGVSIKSIVAARVDAATVQAAGGVSLVKVQDWLSGQIQAGWVGSLATQVYAASGSAGHFGADVTLTGGSVPVGKPTLSSAKIAGNLLAGSVWDVQVGFANSISVTGTVQQSIICSAGDIKSLTVGASDSSDFGAGVAMSLLASNRHIEVGDVANAPQATIGTFTVKGLKLSKGSPIPRFFMDSCISAGIGKLNLLNWDDHGGLFAPVGGVVSVKHRDTFDSANCWIWPAPPTQVSAGPDDFVHII